MIAVNVRQNLRRIDRSFVDQAFLGRDFPQQFARITRTNTRVQWPCATYNGT